MQYIDPAQPPAEKDWADAWLQLARVRLRAGKNDTAIALARMAGALDSALSEEVEELAREGGLLQFDFLKIDNFAGGCLGTLVLEKWLESVTDLGPLCTGGVVWKAGELLAKAFPVIAKLRGCKVLELGSGTGAAGLAAALCGAQVLLTDLRESLPFLEKNVARNRDMVFDAGGSVEVQPLDYRDVDSAASFKAYDFVIGTDLVWREDQPEPLARWCAASRLPALLVYKARWKWLPEALQAAYSSAGLEVQTLPHTDHLFENCLVHLLLPAGLRISTTWLRDVPL